MASCYLCAAHILPGQGFRREVRTGRSWRVYYTRRGGSSYGETHGLRTLCGQCAAAVDYFRQGRGVRTAIGVFVALLGWYVAFNMNFTGDAGAVVLIFLALGGPGWLVYLLVEKLHALAYSPPISSSHDEKLPPALAPAHQRPENSINADPPMEKLPTTSRLDHLMALSVSPASLKPDGRYTRPRTWGVYRLPTSAQGRVYRSGNHPIRREELEREHGSVFTVAVFLDPALAQEVAAISNAAAGAFPQD